MRGSGADFKHSQDDLADDDKYMTQYCRLSDHRTHDTGSIRLLVPEGVRW